VQGQSIRQITKQFSLSRNTVRKILRKDITKLEYKRTIQPRPKLELFTAYLEKELEVDKSFPRKRRRTAKKFFEEIEEQGYSGSYDNVRRYIKIWKIDNIELSNKVYIPLSFEPGEAFQFDWSEEKIIIKGQLTKVKVAHVKLCYSRLSLSIVYPNEQQEMVHDAHNKAFAWFGGCCERGIYDNMKTAVTKILIGKDRIFNQRFLQLCSHYLFEPIACNPRAGWEKGQIEKQVHTVRQNFFVPLLKVNSIEELNQELSEKCSVLDKKIYLSV
jgi:transposase